MKKILLIIISSLLPLIANAEKVEIDGVYYNLIAKGNVAEVTNNPHSYTGSVTIPAKVTYEDKEYDVISIGYSAFNNASKLIHVEISEGITSIGENAFFKCEHLTSVSIPNSVNSIGRAAFMYCLELDSIVIPHGVEVIETNVFGSCLNLSHVVISNSVTRIGNSAFNSCCKLDSLLLPNSVTTIEDWAFAGCEDLTFLRISTSLKEVGKGAFAGCPLLKELHIEDLASWCEINFSDASGNPLTTSNCLLLNNEEVTELVIPDRATYIGNYSFYGCTSIVSLSIGDSVTKIGNYAFGDCSGIVSVSIGDNVTNIGNNAFYYCGGMETLTIGNGTKSINDNAFKGCKKISSVTIGNSLERIGKEAFSKCEGITDFYCYTRRPPTIGQDAFKDAYIDFTTLHVPSSSISLYENAEPWNSFKSIVKLDIPTHQLSYFIDDDLYKTYTLEEGEEISAEVAPEKEGHTFSGWSEIPKTMPTHDVTVMGTFNVNKYKLTYLLDGLEYKDTEIVFGATIPREAVPEKEGYTFSGWSDIPETMPAHDVTIVGTFTINKYKLSYQLDGAEYKVTEIEFGATITEEADPEKEGHTFSGWSDIPETMPAHDVTVIGTFTINKYKLTYLLNGAEYKVVEIEFGATITEEAVSEKEGHTFSGWSDIPETMPAHDVTVIGTFNVNKYKLTYLLDGLDYKVTEIEFGAPLTVEAAPEKEGHTFSGWSDIPETMPSHDVTVTGTFNVNKYKLTYLLDGVVYKSYDVKFGSTIIPESESALVKEGYTFSGWSDIPDEMPACDVIITGTFYVNQYSITYIIDGEIYATESVDFGSVITPPSPQTKDGLEFTWDEFPEFMPAHDIIIEGSYVATDISMITFNSRVSKIYSIDGKQRQIMGKGFNIVQMNDGTIKKIIVK